MAAGTHSKCHARSGGRVGDVTASHKLRFPRHAGPPHLCQDHASSLLHSKESQSGWFADRLSHSLFLISRFNAARPALHCIPFPFPIMAAVPECSRSVRAISCSCDVGSCVRPSASVRGPHPSVGRSPRSVRRRRSHSHPFFSKSALCLSVSRARPRPDARSDPSAQKYPRFCHHSSHARPFFAIQTHDIRRELDGPKNIMGCPSPLSIRMKSGNKTGR